LRRKDVTEFAKSKIGRLPDQDDVSISLHPTNLMGQLLVVERSH